MTQANQSGKLEPVTMPTKTCTVCGKAARAICAGHWTCMSDECDRKLAEANESIGPEDADAN